MSNGDPVTSTPQPDREKLEYSGVDADAIYEAGYETGYRAGFRAGMSAGQRVGQKKVDTGGYDRGYNDGLKAAKDSLPPSK